MQKALKTVLGSILLVVSLFSFSAFTFAPTSMNPHATPTRATAHTTPAKSTSPTVTCYGQAITGDTATFPAEDTTRFPWDPDYDFVTSGYCNDINMKFLVLSSPMEIQICFDRTGTCNSWKTLTQTNHWYLLATDVLPGTKFHYNMRLPNTTTFKWVVAY